MESLYLTREQVREIDRRAIDELGIPGIVLMENAGRGCVDMLERLGINGPVVVLCGKGNNAGDGFVISRHLAVRGIKCCVLLLAAPNSLTGDAATNFEVVRNLQLPYVDLSQFAESHDGLFSALDEHGSAAAWLVDALLGTGAQGEPRPPLDSAIEWINRRGAQAQVVAVDVPSGLDCDTGKPAMHTVRADHTCTFVAEKIGFRSADAQPYVGQVHVLDIGVPSGW